MRRPLTTAALAFLAANLLHTADHFRQGVGSLTAEILVAGTGLTLSAAVVLVLVVRDHPRAPLFAVVAGFSGAAGILASHVAPHWSALSDPYPAIGADALSWIVMLIEVGTALALGAAGLRASGARAPTPRRA
ncbi:MAG: hypothetical protein QOG68_953 [Solirubrobacteraceae bacterium]|nr:hypothetical protein [Solirubrobacteraceae bacterium]